MDTKMCLWGKLINIDWQLFFEEAEVQGEKGRLPNSTKGKMFSRFHQEIQFKLMFLKIPRQCLYGKSVEMETQAQNYTSSHIKDSDVHRQHGNWRAV